MPTRFWFLILIVLLGSLFTQNLTLSQGDILTVNSTASGTTSGGCDADCTLLDAISQSDGSIGVQTIQFNIPGTGPFTILTSSGFRIRESVIIDATTQPGYSGKPLIQIRPSITSVSYGIYVEDGFTFDTTLSVTIRGLAISGFVNGPGIMLGNGQNHLIEQNFIGVDVTGTIAQPNDGGITIRSRNNIVRQNVISGNENAGIYIYSNGERLGLNNQIIGNFVGTNFNGTSVIPNQDGIQIREAAANNIVGGTTAADRNIISGNTRWGIFTDGRDDAPSLNANSTTIQGNYIGTDVTGTLDLGNAAEGIFIQRSDNNVVGGTIGTSPEGSCTGACNLISGNQTGINIVGDELGTAENNTVQGNFIGTTVSGTAALGNGTDGISIGSSGNTIGGITPAARNLISGNLTNGIRLSDLNAFGNIITGNYVGTDTTGLSGVPNRSYGIYINAAAYGNQIGDGTDEGANWIGFNGVTDDRAGIGIDSSPVSGFYPDQNRITGNSIFYNSGLGVDLLPIGVTANDVGDADTGANGLQNAPVVTSVVTQNTTLVNGTLNSAPNRAYTIELFYSTDCDISGYGEGEFFLGGLAVTTDSSGNAIFQTEIDPPLPVDVPVTAIAIDQDATLNSAIVWNTSEFSACQVAQADLAMTKGDSLDPVLPGDDLTYTLSVSNPNNASFAENVVVTDVLPVGLAFNSANSSQGACSFDAPTRTVSCNVGQLLNNTTATITVDTSVDLGITIPTLNNTASVTSDTFDPVLTNNTAMQATALAQANLQVTITDLPDPVMVDALLVYKAVVTNLGSHTATNVVLTDTLPANVVLVAATPTQGTCTPASGTVSCSLGTLANGSSATVSVIIRPEYQTQNTTILNMVSVSALQIDTMLSNNAASVTTKVNPSTVGPTLMLFTTNTPTLTWNTVSWATLYEVEVDDDSSFMSPNFEDEDIAPTVLFVQTTPLADGMWYWRVRARKADGSWSNWSVSSFVIDQP